MRRRGSDGAGMERSSSFPSVGATSGSRVVAQEELVGSDGQSGQPAADSAARPPARVCPSAGVQLVPGKHSRVTRSFPGMVCQQEQSRSHGLEVGVLLAGGRSPAERDRNCSGGAVELLYQTKTTPNPGSLLMQKQSFTVS